MPVINKRTKKNITNIAKDMNNKLLRTYTNEVVEKSVYKHCPTLALLPKDFSFVGSCVKTSLGFEVTRAKKYAVSVVDLDAVKPNQVESGLKNEFKNSIINLGEKISKDLFVDGGSDAVTGFSFWLPGKKLPGILFSVDRNVDTVALGGIYKDSTTDPELKSEEAIILLTSELARNGGNPDLVVVSPSRYKNLYSSLNQKEEIIPYDIHDDKGNVVSVSGMEGIKILGPTGPLHIYADRCCPDDKIYVLQKDTWKFASLGPAIRPVYMGGELVRSWPDKNWLEARAGFYGNLICENPGLNGVYTF